MSENKIIKCCRICKNYNQNKEICKTSNDTVEIWYYCPSFEKKGAIGDR